MFAIADLSFDTTEAETQPEVAPQWAQEFTPGIPPQAPIENQEEVERDTHRPAPGNRPHGFAVVLRRGCYSGFAHGELLVRRYPEAYTVLDHFMPDFRRFRLGEYRKAFVKNPRDIAHCFVVEIVCDTVSGPTFRVRPADRDYPRVIHLPWKQLTQRSLQLNVTPDVQSALVTVTGIHFTAMGSTQSPPITPTVTNGDRDHGHKKPTHHQTRRPGRLNTWAAWHVERD